MHKAPFELVYFRLMPVLKMVYQEKECSKRRRRSRAFRGEESWPLE